MRRLLLLLPLVFANLGQAPAVKGGTVTGKVQAILKGEPLKKLENVYVYLEPEGRVSSAIGKDVVAQVMQQGTEFGPKVTVIPNGATIYFPNRDPEDHNVWSPAVKANQYIGFDLGRYQTDKTGRKRKFLQVGEYDIYCDIHVEMWAKVKVVPSRYFVRVNDDGSYAIRDVPPGSYRLVAWAPDSKESPTAERFAVEADKPTTAEPLNVQITISTHAHKRRDGSDYPPVKY